MTIIINLSGTYDVGDIIEWCGDKFSITKVIQSFKNGKGRYEISKFTSAQV